LDARKESLEKCKETEESLENKMLYMGKQAINIDELIEKEEGVFGGMSSGGGVSASIRLANELEEGLIVCIICDRGDRYLSSGLFGD
jgi:cysteine synthase B